MQLGAENLRAGGKTTQSFDELAKLLSHVERLTI